MFHMLVIDPYIMYKKNYENADNSLIDDSEK
jgi:hypothetical protein